MIELFLRTSNIPEWIHEQTVALETGDRFSPISSLDYTFRCRVTEMFARRRGRPAWTPRAAAAASCLLTRESRAVRNTESSRQPTKGDQNCAPADFAFWQTLNPKINTVLFDLCSKILMCLLSSQQEVVFSVFLLYRCTSAVSAFGSRPTESDSDSRWTCFTLLPHGVVFSFLIRALLNVVACVNMILFIVFLISAFIVLPYFHAEAIKIFFN